MFKVPYTLGAWSALIVIGHGESYERRHEFVESYLSAAADREPEMLERKAPPAPWWVMN